MPSANRLEWIAKYAAIISALVAASIGIGQFRQGVAQSDVVLRTSLVQLPCGIRADEESR